MQGRVGVHRGISTRSIIAKSHILHLPTHTVASPAICPSARLPVCLCACRKASGLFEKDQRYVAVESEREREELFDDYIVDLGKKVRGEAAQHLNGMGG